MIRSCLECGADVPPRSKGRGGNQPGFCSDRCRLRRKRQTTRQWIETHHNQKLAKDAEYREAYKAAHPDYFRDHYAKHREKRKKESQEWYRYNADRAGRQRLVYVANNPDKVRAWGRKSANTRLAVTKKVFVEVVDPRVVFERDKGTCGICRERVEMTSPWEVDHIVPISKGGAHSYDNVQLAHRKCNRAKAARVPKGQPTLFQVVA